MTPQHMDLWTRPPCYHGAVWPDWYSFLGQSRESSCLERANFDAGLKAVKAVASKDLVPGDEDDLFTVMVIREKHWAVGWVEWIGIHKSDSAALAVADKIMDKLVDDDLFSQYEQEDADLIWKDCYQPKERISYIQKHRDQFSFHDFKDMLACARGKHFAGYASELLG